MRELGTESASSRCSTRRLFTTRIREEPAPLTATRARRAAPPTDYRILTDLLKTGACVVRVFGLHHTLVFVDDGAAETYDIHGATVGSLRYRGLIALRAPPSVEYGERVERWAITAAGRRWVVARSARLARR